MTRLMTETTPTKKKLQKNSYDNCGGGTNVHEFVLFILNAQRLNLAPILFRMFHVPETWVGYYLSNDEEPRGIEDGKVPLPHTTVVLPAKINRTLLTKSLLNGCSSASLAAQSTSHHQPILVDEVPKLIATMIEVATVSKAAAACNDENSIRTKTSLNNTVNAALLMCMKELPDIQLLF